MKYQHLSGFGETGKAFIRLLSDLSETQLNEIPFSGSWTAAQVGDHVRQSAGGAVQTIYGTVTAANRDEAQNVEQMRTVFLDFSTKMQSPEFILPSQDFIEKTPLIADLEDIWGQLTQGLETLDLSLICTEFEFPGAGALTRLEWLAFSQFHTQRHLHQLEKIHGQLSQKHKASNSN